MDFNDYWIGGSSDMKKCVCGHKMTKHEWKNQWVCHRCGRTKSIQ